jgi:metal-responsive CopG/Arc/MetJ family transcriptional regulator
VYYTSDVKMKKPVSITLEGDLIKAIDKKKGLASRSVYIENIIIRGFECDEEEVEEVAMGYA